MAKSLRSQWKRKMRNVKRVRNSKKELKVLKQTLGLEPKEDTGPKRFVQFSDRPSEDTEVEMKASDAPPKEEATEETVPDTTTDAMELEKEESKFDPMTMKDEHGQYPVWMNQRAIKKLKSKAKKKTGKVTKKRRG